MLDTIITFVKRFRIPLLIGVGTLVFALVSYTAFITPQANKVTQLNAQQVQLQNQVQSLNAQIAVLKVSKSKIPANCAELGTLNQAIPSTPDTNGFLSQVTTLAVQSGDPNTPSITITPVVGSSLPGGLIPLSVTLTTTGNYQQMVSFLSGVAAFPRLFTVTAAGLTAAGPTAYNLTLTGSIYYDPHGSNPCTAAIVAAATPAH